MAAEMERERQNEDNYFPIFIRKKILTEEIKQELEKLKNDFEYQKRKMEDMWQSTYKVVQERHEANLEVNKSLLLNQEIEASTSDASERKENAASEVGFSPEMIDPAASEKKENAASEVGFSPEMIDPAASERKENAASEVGFSPEMIDPAEEFYKIWIEEFKKNSSRQRGVVQDSVDSLFSFLHRFDDDEEEEKEEPQPKQSVSESPMSKCIYYMSVLVLFVTCVLFIFQDYDLLKCNDELLVCIREIIITLAFKIWNFYLKFHDITMDYSNLSDINHLPIPGDVCDS